MLFTYYWSQRSMCDSYARPRINEWMVWASFESTLLSLKQSFHLTLSEMIPRKSITITLLIAILQICSCSILRWDRFLFHSPGVANPRPACGPPANNWRPAEDLSLNMLYCSYQCIQYWVMSSLRLLAPVLNLVK